MPTYVCMTIESRLSAEQKAEIAREITRIHSEVTGAPGYFAQVIFKETKPENYFMNGVPLRHDQIFVHGRVRAGRAMQDKSRMIVLMSQAIERITKVSNKGVIIYVGDLPPKQMIEFGHVLPEPGDEEKWAAALPPADRAWMQSIGK